jgi:hypothetical protein
METQYVSCEVGTEFKNIRMNFILRVYSFRHWNFSRKYGRNGDVGTGRPKAHSAMEMGRTQPERYFMEIFWHRSAIVGLISFGMKRA